MMEGERKGEGRELLDFISYQPGVARTRFRSAVVSTVGLQEKRYGYRVFEIYVCASFDERVRVE